MSDDEEFVAARKLALLKMPHFSEKIQKDNPLVKKILALKLGKDVKDKKVVEETHKEMLKTANIREV